MLAVFQSILLLKILLFRLKVVFSFLLLEDRIKLDKGPKNKNVEERDKLCIYYQL